MEKIENSKNLFFWEIEHSIVLFNRHTLQIAFVNKSYFYKQKESLYILYDSEDDKAVNEISYIGSMYLLLTTKCNFNCKYCTILNNTKNDKITLLSNELINKSLDLIVQGNKEHIRSITFYGGEPLLNVVGLKYALGKIKELENDGYLFNKTIITNGSLVTHEIANLLKDHSVFAIVSMDGLESEHNQFRVKQNNTGSFSDVQKGYRLLYNNGNKVGISLVIGTHNLHKLDEISINIKTELNPISIGNSLPHYFPSVDDGIDWSEGLRFIENTLNACCEYNLWNEQLMNRVRPFITGIPRLYSCSSPKNGCMVRILPNGDISLCENLGFRDKYVLSNINTADFCSIINHPLTKLWYNRTHHKLKECQGCYASGICGAGCPYDSYLLHKDIYNIEPRNCAISKMIVKWVVKKLADSISSWDENVIIPNKHQLNSLIPARPI